ncbi:Cobyric acid synthase [Methyloligella halotolerans]|uniref:Cobyric acid synthase n=1 Tax=Methyloligella halotolerans TaxID=1177755 RepID=A0A1E2S1H6_9HYPH|nr:cobyric acid synthase [Methyloligella halotolerans]ODA68272.1 Cobyric acid synthase [Methyloligella halotolerans]
MKAIMFQGTGSDVGKSLLVAGFSRVFRRRGLKVAPFKPQNMSNNAAVTADGGEIGRAQALQARAAGLPLSVHMNPVLLKPQSDIGAQVVVQGKVMGTAKASAYQSLKPKLMAAVLNSFERLGADADLVLVEGAGSPAEVNLRANDIANMGFARTADVPVVLIGDIDRGGVIASLVGTKTVIDPADAEQIAGFLVNKFRGDPALFADGMTHIAELTGWRALGLIPYLHAAQRLPEEDALGVKARPAGAKGNKVRIAVLAYPRISNFDDFDPLAQEPGVDLVYLNPGTPVPGDADLVILPGSKATIADLRALRETGWDIDLAAHLRRGGQVLGICGGYQMLGRKISDPEGIEGEPGSIKGLGLLDVKTLLTREKLLHDVTGKAFVSGLPFKGYEMHVGRTGGPDCARPMLLFADGREDGASNPAGNVQGCHVHGLFTDDGQRGAWLERLGAGPSAASYEAEIDAALDALADHLERHVDCDALLSLAREPRLKG